MRSLFTLLRLVLWGVALSGFCPAAAKPASPDCRQAISAAEADQSIPRQLLAAIGHVESGRADPVTGRISPWPWTVDVDGQGHYYANKQQAIAAVVAARARGVQSIDVGCLQINLMHHPNAFASLDQAFDPVENANYGALFLRQLHDQIGSWPQAAGAYHSQTPALGQAYERMVMRAWPDEKQLTGNDSSAPMLADFAPAVPGGLPAPIPTFPGARSFRPVMGLIRMGSALPPMGHPNLLAANQSPAAPTRANDAVGGIAPTAGAGRGLAAYRRVPVRVTGRRGLL